MKGAEQRGMGGKFKGGKRRGKEGKVFEKQRRFWFWIRGK